jgi:hypothetical protein
MEEPRNPLDARVKTAWRLQSLLVFVPALIFVSVGALAASAAGIPPVLPAIATLVVLLGGGAGIAIVPEVAYRRWRWEVAEEEVRLREGLIVVTHTVIPMVRIQHADTSQGPIMRMLGLMDVHISTAAGRHTIPALSVEHAAQLRDRIATLARATDDGGL